jgi:hypothetical protein
MRRKNIQCSLAGMERTTALRAQGQCGFDGIVGFGTLQGQQHRRLKEDDGLWARGRRGLMASWAWEQRRVHSVMGLRRVMLLQPRQWCYRLGDGACVVDGVTGSGLGGWRWIKGLDSGRER